MASAAPVPWGDEDACAVADAAVPVGVGGEVATPLGGALGPHAASAVPTITP
jgi:hypothetical protein